MSWFSVMRSPIFFGPVMLSDDEIIDAMVDALVHHLEIDPDILLGGDPDIVAATPQVRFIMGVLLKRLRAEGVVPTD